MADYLTALLKELLLEIILKATARIDAHPYVLDNIKNSVFTLLNIRGTCKTLREASDCDVAYRSCRVEELPNLVAIPLEVAKFVDLLFIRRKPNVLFLRGICTMFVGDNYFKGLKMVEEDMEAGNI